MRVLQINGTSFQGKMMNYDVSKGEKDLANNSYWQKNSSIQQTVGSYHKNYTGKAYFADPLEKISDSIRDRADFIVYDNEPAYPEIEKVEKNYLGRLRHNFKEDFEEVRNYYYRREMGGHADIAEAKYQQWQAAECGGLYDKAGDLRYKKEISEDKAARLAGVKENLEKVMEKTQSEYNTKALEKAQLEIDLKTLNKKTGLYSELVKTMTKSTSTDAEIKSIKNFLLNNSRLVLFMEKEAQNCEKTLSVLKSKLQKYPKLIESVEKNMKIQNGKIADFTNKLKPLFYELKLFYAKQGLKIIKK